VRDTPERLAALEHVRADVLDAGKVRSLHTEEADQLSVDVQLAEAG
jgi:hypothetical protein